MCGRLLLSALGLYCVDGGSAPLGDRESIERPGQCCLLPSVKTVVVRFELDFEGYRVFSPAKNCLCKTLATTKLRKNPLTRNRVTSVQSPLSREMLPLRPSKPTHVPLSRKKTARAATGTSQATRAALDCFMESRSTPLTVSFSVCRDTTRDMPLAHLHLPSNRNPKLPSACQGLGFFWRAMHIVVETDSELHGFGRRAS